MRPRSLVAASALRAVIAVVAFSSPLAAQATPTPRRADSATAAQPSAAENADLVVVYSRGRRPATCSDALPPFRAPALDSIQWLPETDSLRLAANALHEAKADSVIRAALRRARAALPGPSVTLCLSLSQPSPILRRLGNVTGFYTVTSGAQLFADPSEGWLQLLPFTTSHEYHHAVVFEKDLQPGPHTGLWAVILEAKADHFAAQLYPDIVRPWHKPLAPADSARCYDALGRWLLHPATPEFRQEIMIGRQDSVPLYCGRSAGRQILAQYLTNRPGLSMDAITRAMPQQICTEAPVCNALLRR